MTDTKTQNDVIENLHQAVIQHGKFNNRIYLMKLGDTEPNWLLPQLIKLAQKNGYTKIFAKIPAPQVNYFLNAGFEIEAAVKKFYNGKTTAEFLGYYLDEKRKHETDAAELEHVLQLSLQYPKLENPVELDQKFSLRKCTRNDVKKMAEIYSEVFPSYPFAIDSPEYLLETMKTHVDYFCVEAEGQMVALSSAEKDSAEKNVEMTDFATLPKWRGNGLAVKLLEMMEQEMHKQKFKTAYTIARAISPGMNITFAKMDYKYCGRLINNTDISGKIESMNVWAKQL